MPENIVAPKTNLVTSPVETTTDDPQTEQITKAEQVQQLTDVANESKQVDVDSLIPSDPYLMDPLFFEVANYFGIEQGDYDAAKNHLSDIVDYVIRDIKSNQPDKVLLALRALERRLEPPGYDEKRYRHFHKYIRLAQKQGAITQAMKAFEKEEADQNKKPSWNGPWA